MTFAQTIIYRAGSNALPIPMRGPHLEEAKSITTSPEPHGGIVPIFDIRAPSESMANDHNIIPSLVEHSPCFVRDRNLAEHDTRLECKRIDGMDILPVDQVAQRGHVFVMGMGQENSIVRMAQ